MDFKDISDFSSENYLIGDNGTVVYLESTDDVFIFKKWFGHLLSKIEFKSVSGEKANGGCRNVIKRIKEINDSSLPFYGVVDRDALLNNIETHEALWWETDDHTFINAFPFGDRVFILHRWELENYLLHPDVIAHRIKNKTMGTVDYQAEELAEKILDKEDDLLAITVLSTLGYGQSSVRFLQEKSDQDLWNEVNKITKGNPEKRDRHKNNIVQFIENTQAPLERWDKLSRMLDGKRTMIRIDGILSNKTICLEQERGDLADGIANLGLIDSYLKNWLESLVRII